MKQQALFSLKNNEKVFIDVVCCSRDWRFKGFYGNHYQKPRKYLLYTISMGKSLAVSVDNFAFFQ